MIDWPERAPVLMKTIPSFMSPSRINVPDGNSPDAGGKLTLVIQAP
jgi:hypothetical protein